MAREDVGWTDHPFLSISFLSRSFLSISFLSRSIVCASALVMMALILDLLQHKRKRAGGDAKKNF